MRSKRLKTDTRKTFKKSKRKTKTQRTTKNKTKRSQRTYIKKSRKSTKRKKTQRKRTQRKRTQRKRTQRAQRLKGGMDVGPAVMEMTPDLCAIQRHTNPPYIEEVTNNAILYTRQGGDPLTDADAEAGYEDWLKIYYPQDFENEFVTLNTGDEKRSNDFYLGKDQ
jgi:hypothetical protein